MKKLAYTIWWNAECQKKRRKVAVAFTKWKVGKGEKEQWRSERREFRKFLEKF